MKSHCYIWFWFLQWW